MMLKKPRSGIVLLSMSIAVSLIGCGMPDSQEDSVSAENVTINTHAQQTDNTVIPLKSSGTADGCYEYYLTKEELMADIEQGCIFRVDTSFKKPTAPFVSPGEWSFYVYEENTVNLEIAFSNLLMKPKENIFPMGEQIIVEVISPDGESVYRFEKLGDEITEDAFVQEQIPVTPGEWTLIIGFAYFCGETPAHLKIAAVYETPSEEDMDWLKEERFVPYWEM